MEMITNQIILPCKSELRYIEKRWTKSKKWHRHKSPQGGWWIGSKEPIQKDFLFLLEEIENINKFKLMHFGPCYLGSKGLQQACNKLNSKHNGGGSFWEALVHPRVGKWAESPSLFVRTDKKRWAIQIKCAQTCFKIFWVTTLVTKKT